MDEFAKNPRRVYNKNVYNIMGISARIQGIVLSVNAIYVFLKVVLLL